MAEHSFWQESTIGIPLGENLSVRRTDVSGKSEEFSTLSCTNS